MTSELRAVRVMPGEISNLRCSMRSEMASCFTPHSHTSQSPLCQPECPEEGNAGLARPGVTGKRPVVLCGDGELVVAEIQR